MFFSVAYSPSSVSPATERNVDKIGLIVREESGVRKGCLIVTEAVASEEDAINFRYYVRRDDRNYVTDKILNIFRLQRSEMVKVKFDKVIMLSCRDAICVRSPTR